MKPFFTYCFSVFLTVLCAVAVSREPCAAANAQISTLAPLISSNEQPDEKLLRLSKSYQTTRSPAELKALVLFLNRYMQTALCNASAYPCVTLSDKKNEAGRFDRLKPEWKTHYPVSCILSARLVEQIIPVLLPDTKVFRVSLSTRQDEKRMTHYVSLLFDTKSRRYFYLSFTDGQFVEAPKDMVKHVPALRADADNKLVLVSSQEYLKWYLEQGLHRADFFALDLTINSADSADSIYRKLELAISAKTKLNGHFEAVNWYELPKHIPDHRLIAHIDPAIKNQLVLLFKLQQRLRVAA